MSESSAPAVELEERLGHAFADPALLERALTHPSRAQESDGTRGNERLEFLGDAVLDLVVSELLYAAHPDWTEGELTRARAALVRGEALAERARALELGDAVRLGRTERREGPAKKRILANVFEAVLGALYLDGGLAPVEALVRREFAELLAAGDVVLARDPKTELQEWAHARQREKLHYTIVLDSGVENDDGRFESEVRLEGVCWGRGLGRTKRAAEQAAARTALQRAAREDEALVGVGEDVAPEGAGGRDEEGDARG